jgi:hypothetical protein
MLFFFSIRLGRNQFKMDAGGKRQLSAEERKERKERKRQRKEAVAVDAATAPAGPAPCEDGSSGSVEVESEPKDKKAKKMKGKKAHKDKGMPADAAGAAGSALADALLTFCELTRFRQIKRLRSLLRTQCMDAGVRKVPLLTFERWLCRAQLSEPGRRPDADVVLPMGGWTDDGLIHDLTRAGCSEAAAANAVGALTTASAAAAAEVAALLAPGGSSAGIPTVNGVAEGSMVHVERRRSAMHYSLGKETKPFFKLNLKHHTKLERLWRAQHKATLAAAKINPSAGAEGEADAGAGKPKPKEKRPKHKHIKMGQVEIASFNHAVWRLLARYRARFSTEIYTRGSHCV